MSILSPADDAEASKSIKVEAEVKPLNFLIGIPSVDFLLASIALSSSTSVLLRDSVAPVSVSINFIDSFESCIISFLKQGAKISKHRIFLDVDKGGLGLTPPLVFIESLKVNVFLKGMKSNDTWGIELRSKLLLKDCPHSIVPDSFNPRLNPILHILAKSFNKFSNKFWLKEGNTMNAYIMANQLFVNHNGERLDESFFHGETWNRYKQIIKYLPLKAFLDENTNRFINFNNFCTVNNIRLTYNEFFRLQHIFRPYVNKYKRILCNFSSEINLLKL